MGFEESRTVLWNVSGAGHPYGNARQGGGLSFVVVLNCGHMVPTDQPAAALDLLHRFLDERSWTDFPAQEDALHQAFDAARAEVEAVPLHKPLSAERSDFAAAPSPQWQTSVLQILFGALVGAAVTAAVSRRSTRRGGRGTEVLNSAPYDAMM